jgi:hypothetical protein
MTDQADISTSVTRVYVIAKTGQSGPQRSCAGAHHGQGGPSNNVVQVFSRRPPAPPPPSSISSDALQCRPAIRSITATNTPAKTRQDGPGCVRAPGRLPGHLHAPGGTGAAAERSASPCACSHGEMRARRYWRAPCDSAETFGFCAVAVRSRSNWATAASNASWSFHLEKSGM